MCLEFCGKLLCILLATLIYYNNLKIWILLLKNMLECCHHSIVLTPSKGDKHAYTRKLLSILGQKSLSYKAEIAPAKPIGH